MARLLEATKSIMSKIGENVNGGQSDIFILEDSQMQVLEAWNLVKHRPTFNNYFSWELTDLGWEYLLDNC